MIIVHLHGMGAAPPRRPATVEENILLLSFFCRKQGLTGSSDNNAPAADQLTTSFISLDHLFRGVLDCQKGPKGVITRPAGKRLNWMQRLTTQRYSSRCS